MVTATQSRSNHTSRDQFRFAAFFAGPRQLAILFLAQTFIAILLLSLLVPPFENSDEFNHFNRVDQIASGGLVAVRYGGLRTSGGLTDPGINEIDSIIGGIRFHPERKVSGAMLREAGRIHWSRPKPLNFINTAVYSPLLYIPAVFGVWAGKILGLSIDRTLILSRALTGAAAMIPAAIAIALAREAAPLLLVLLTLPMTLSLFASVSQDGPMIAIAAFAIALVNRDRMETKLGLSGFCICLALLGIGRPAYMPLAILPLVMEGVSWRRRALGATAVLLAISVWSGLVLEFTMIDDTQGRGIDPVLQFVGLLRHPGRVGLLAWNAVTVHQGMEGRSFFVEFVGMLGWIDVALPRWFYWMTGAALMLAMSSALVRPTPMLPLRVRGVLFAAIAASTGLIFLLEYLTWTPVGLPWVQGVQGRYFLPLAVMLVYCLPASSHYPLQSLREGPALLVIMFPLISVVATVSSVVRRYYI